MVNTPKYRIQKTMDGQYYIEEAEPYLDPTVEDGPVTPIHWKPCGDISYAINDEQAKKIFKDYLSEVSSMQVEDRTVATFDKDGNEL